MTLLKTQNNKKKQNLNLEFDLNVLYIQSFQIPS